MLTTHKSVLAEGKERDGQGKKKKGKLIAKFVNVDAPVRRAKAF